MPEDLWSLPVVFYFDVQIAGMSLPFTEVSGLTQSIEIEHIQEGGGSGYELPKKVSSGKIVLKRAINPDNKDVFDKWLEQTFSGTGKLSPRNLKISLMDHKGLKQCMWSVIEAYPVKWDVGKFDAKENGIAMETTELVCHEIKRSW